MSCVTLNVKLMLDWILAEGQRTIDLALMAACDM